MTIESNPEYACDRCGTMVHDGDGFYPEDLLGGTDDRTCEACMDKHNEARHKMDSLLEDVAFVSSEFHSDHRFKGFYSTRGESLNGFLGIIEWCSLAGQVFNHVAVHMPSEHIWNDCDYVQSVYNFVNAMYEHYIGSPLENVWNSHTLAGLAREAIEKTRYKVATP